ncbi:MAG: hypothetical protein M3Y84_00230, partial [Acidobacteriota bacterium]|nr:hypothetical protein [Acidobacteriota bacterium]
LYTISFTTPQGQINVNLADDLTGGDTISGTLEKVSAGKTDSERAKTQAELNHYIVEWGQQQTSVAEKSLTRNIPVAPTTTDRMIRLLRNGREVARTELPISSAPKPTPTDFILPTGAQQGKLIEVTGSCDGLFRNTDYIKIGETSLPILAESPRKKIGRDTSETVGPTKIESGENGRMAECPFRNLGIQLSAGKLSLLKGETTTLHLVVIGLAGISEDVPLELVNQSPGVISMSGGESQHMIINASAVREAGSYTIDRMLTGVTAGSFGITATVKWSNVCTHP